MLSLFEILIFFLSQVFFSIDFEFKKYCIKYYLSWLLSFFVCPVKVCTLGQCLTHLTQLAHSSPGPGGESSEASVVGPLSDFLVW